MAIIEQLNGQFAYEVFLPPEKCHKMCSYSLSEHAASYEVLSYRWQCCRTRLLPPDEQPVTKQIICRA